MSNPAPIQNPDPNFPPGYRFRPTEDELITYYLARKVANLPFPFDAISQINVYDYPPWQLPVLSKFKSSEKECFFFNLVGKKFGSSTSKNGCVIKASRKTPLGYWKAGGKEREIRKDGKVVGWKKLLTFQVGTCRKRQKTDWIMHEYRRVEDDYVKTKGTFLVVCRVYEKSTVGQLEREINGVPLAEDEGEDSEEEAACDLVPDKEATFEGIEQVTIEKKSKVGQASVHHESSSLKSNTPSERIFVPGFRFHPTDNELIDYYLKQKVSGLPLHVDAITDIDVYKWAPWDLPSLSHLSLKNMEWYFFTFLDQKHSYSLSFLNANRDAVEGHWRSSGTNFPVLDAETKKVIGMTKHLSFHKGKSPLGLKTDWVLHEYRLGENDQFISGSICVVCKIYKKSGSFMRKRRNRFEAVINEEKLEHAVQDLKPTKELELPINESLAAPMVDINIAEGHNYMHSSNDSEQVSHIS